MKLPVLDSRKIIKILILKGYDKIGQKGSHVQFKNKEGKIITVATHPGKSVSRGLLRKIIRDLEISREEFIKLSEEI